VRTGLWDTVFVVVTVVGGLVAALVAALTFARAWRARNRPFSNVAAVGVFVICALFSITAVLFLWWFLGPAKLRLPAVPLFFLASPLPNREEIDEQAAPITPSYPSTTSAGPKRFARRAGGGR
jgi:hypothetical protein